MDLKKKSIVCWRYRFKLATNILSSIYDMACNFIMHAWVNSNGSSINNITKNQA